MLVIVLARALRSVEFAEHIYSFVFSDGVDHLHVLLLPRYPRTPIEYYGLRVHDWPDAPRGGDTEMRTLSDRIRGRLCQRRVSGADSLCTRTTRPIHAHRVTPRAG
jgi:hypothetical protein